MGIIQFFKELREFSKLMKQIPQEMKERQTRNLAMSHAELASLPDDELFTAAFDRIEALVDYDRSDYDNLSALNDQQKVVYVLNLLEMEVNNGGLCQFFVNSSRTVAPYVSEYLGIVGASEHKALFDGFISKYNIDLKDLSSFVIHRARDFEKMAKRYPFDEYDGKFYELPSLEKPLTAYIRQNLNAF